MAHPSEDDALALQLSKPRIICTCLDALCELWDDTVKAMGYVVDYVNAALLTDAGWILSTSAVVSAFAPLAYPNSHGVLLGSVALSFQLSTSLAWFTAGITCISCVVVGSEANSYSREERKFARLPYQVLLLSSVCQLCFLGFPSHLQLLALHLPTASTLQSLRCLQDLLILPLWLRALGHISGQSPSLAWSTPLAVGGTFCQLGLALDSQLRFLWAPAVLAQGWLCGKILLSSPSSPGESSRELGLVTTTLATYVLYGLFVEAMGLTHMLNGQQLLAEYATLDLVTKVSGCHILAKNLKSRGPFAEPWPRLPTLASATLHRGAHS